MQPDALEVVPLGVGPAILGAMRDEHEDAGGRQRVEEPAQELLAAPVDPVDVFDQQDQRLCRCEAVHEIAHGLEDHPRLDSLAQAGAALVTRIDAEQVAVDGLAILHPTPVLGAAPLHLRDDLRGGIRLVHVEESAQEIDHRQVGRIAAVAHALTFDPCVSIAVETAAELVDETRLADPRLTGDEDHLAHSALRLGEALVE